MNFLSLPLFRDKGKAKAMLIILGALTFALLAMALVSWGTKTYKLNAYDRVMAVVTDFDTRDGNNVWTEFAYTHEGSAYTVRLDGHSYWMRMGAEIELLVKPSEPDKVEVLRNIGVNTSTYLIGAIPFGVVFLIYLINYITILRKERSSADGDVNNV